MAFYNDGDYMGTELPDMHPAWTSGPSLDYYKRGAHKLSDVYTNCKNCPARYWTDPGIHICLVKKEKKDPYMGPTCTEQEWDIFVLEYV